MVVLCRRVIMIYSNDSCFQGCLDSQFGLVCPDPKLSDKKHPGVCVCYVSIVLGQESVYVFTNNLPMTTKKVIYRDSLPKPLAGWTSFYDKNHVRHNHADHAVGSKQTRGVFGNYTENGRPCAFAAYPDGAAGLSEKAVEKQWWPQIALNSCS